MAIGSHSWLQVGNLFHEGHPDFVAAIRGTVDVRVLALFAPTWIEDTRPIARQFLKEYLLLGLNCLRHEPLVKRMFKLAEKAGDDQVMGWFLVALDRTIRLRQSSKKKYNWRTGRHEISSLWRVQAPEMPRPDERLISQYIARTPNYLDRMSQNSFLFSVATRHYLRRRAWRYFRKLGRNNPERYIDAACEALECYRDEFIPDSAALLDHWGLVHFLFHHSDAIEQGPSFWGLALKKNFADLTFEPMYLKLWKQSEKPLLNLLRLAQCRTVRVFCLQMLKRHHKKALSRLPLEQVIGWLSQPDPDLALFAAEILPDLRGLDLLPTAKWLSILESAPAEAMDVIADLVGKLVSPHRITLEQALELSKRRPIPIAALGMRFLVGKKPQDEVEFRAVCSLKEAQAEPLRPDLVRWACQTLSEVEPFHPPWVLEFLDCRHEDVRREGLEWLRSDPRLNDNPDLWVKMLETPYDDIRLSLLARLEADRESRSEGAIREENLSPELLRFVWATILLNIHRGSRKKPTVIKHLLERLSLRPEEAPVLFPVLAVALRSVRGPEFRSALSGVIQLVEHRPELHEPVRRVFPELIMN